MVGNRFGFGEMLRVDPAAHGMRPRFLGGCRGCFAASAAAGCVASEAQAGDGCEHERGGLGDGVDGGAGRADVGQHVS